VETVPSAKRRAEQKRAFTEAKRSDTVGAVDEFLTSFPESDLAGEARALRAMVVAREEAFKRAMASDDPAVLKTFLQAYPKGVHGLVTACVLGLVVVGSVGVWFADTRRTPVSLKMPPVQSPPVSPAGTPVPPSPAPVQPQAAPAQPPTTPFQPASIGALSPERERALKPKDTFTECDNCPEMVVLPAGSFTMGSPKNETGQFDDESPQRTVKIAKPFAVGKFHVTVDQFAAFVMETGYDSGSKCYALEGGRRLEKEGRSWRDPGFAQAGAHPAVCLNWNDANAYADWLARKTGKTYRLVTEAEWEYAACARTEPGTYPRYSFGNDEKDLCRYGNGADQSTKSLSETKDWTFAPCNDGYVYTSPVGSFAANGFGLYDMLGNAWQWTADCWHDSFAGAPSDGTAWTAGDCGRRVVRGGSWLDDPQFLRSAFRSWDTTVGRFDGIGFRLARTLNP
jgi:formylglycine-generating enzyme required for sulfatase activity